MVGEPPPRACVTCGQPGYATEAWCLDCDPGDGPSMPGWSQREEDLFVRKHGYEAFKAMCARSSEARARANG